MVREGRNDQSVDHSPSLGWIFENDPISWFCGSGFADLCDVLGPRPVLHA
jgi:hypothetical protein